MNIQALITKIERKHANRVPAIIGSRWRPVHATYRNRDGVFWQRVPTGCNGIEGPYHTTDYPIEWWLSVLAALIGAILLTWWPL